MEKSIVHISSYIIEPSYLQPWTIKRKYKISGSGFCIEVPGKVGKFIMTNYHVIKNSVQIFVRKYGFSKSYRMQVAIFSEECDLALLNTEEKEFWENIDPLHFGSIPKKGDKIFAYGYPLGKINVSVTRGIISRLVSERIGDIARGLVFEIDVSINPGNSGGPAINKNGDVIGVVYAGIGATIGLIISTPLVEYFLKAASKFLGKKDYIGISTLGIFWQPSINPNIQKYTGVETGILIVYISKLSPLMNKVKVLDKILKINNIDVNEDGTILLSSIINEPYEELISWDNYIGLFSPNEEITLLVKQKKKTVEITINTMELHPLIYYSSYQIKPSYYIVGGIVFCPASYMLIREMSEEKKDVSIIIQDLERLEYDSKDEEAIMISNIIYSDLVVDYEYNIGAVLRDVNDIKIKNLQHFYKVVNSEIKKSEFLIFSFTGNYTFEKIIFETKDLISKTEEIVSEKIGNIPLFQI